MTPSIKRAHNPTIHDLLKIAADAAEKATPEQTARMRAQLLAGLKKTRSKTRDNIWIN